MKIVGNYVLFWGDHDIYSNFHLAPFTNKGINFNCSEQCFMYCKAMFFKDTTTAQEILKEKVPFNQKKLGRKVKGFDKARWDEQCMRFMTIACTLKFSQNPKLKQMLLDTGDMYIVEASPYDTIWGIGIGENDPRATNPAQWRGQNLLGEVLMAVRARFRQELEQKATAETPAP